MYSGKYVFSQMSAFYDRYEFNKCVHRYRGNRGVRELNCWNRFVQLFFGQLSSCNSLNDICLCLKVHSDKLYHSGIHKQVVHTTLSRANEKRDRRIIADFGNYLIRHVRPLYAHCSIPKIDLADEIFALDSTTISVSINLFTWVKGKYSRGAVKMHTFIDLRGSIPEFIFITDGKYHDSNVLGTMMFYANAIYLMDKAYVDFEALYRINNAGAFSVTRAKDTMQYVVLEPNFNINEATGLRADKIIELTVAKSKRLYPEKLRIVEFYDNENDELLVFVTNNFEVSALGIARLYQNRWQIEVFFKWIKQNLTVKTLCGHSENAVRIHLRVAICTYLIVAYVKVMLESEYSIYQIMQILNVSIFDKTPLRDLLCKQPNSQVKQNFKEQLLF